MTTAEKLTAVAENMGMKLGRSLSMMRFGMRYKKTENRQITSRGFLVFRAKYSNPNMISSSGVLLRIPHTVHLELHISRI